MNKENLMTLLTILSVLLTFVCFGFLFFVEVPEKNVSTVNTGMGILITGTIIQFFQFLYGSSKGSQDKNEQIYDAMKKPPAEQ